jgi:hypothetical protein
VGFERNSDDPTKVILESGDEVILTVNSQSTHFAGNWKWETEDKKWISWKGQTPADFGFTGIHTTKADAADGIIYDLSGRKVTQPQKGIFINNGKKVIIK